MEFNVSNILYFTAYIAPVLVLSIVILIGLLNNNAIGAALFTCIMLIVYFVGMSMQRGLGIVSTAPKHAVCSVFGKNLYMSPSLSSMMLFAAITYVVLPFIMEGQTVSYIPLISVLLSIWVIDFIVKLRNECTNGLGVALGTIGGGFIGGLFTILLYKFLNKGLLFHSTSASNNVTCKKASKSQFKCSVYKNGQIIKQL